MALDRDPTDSQMAAVNEANQLRGVLLGSYAHVEFTLADLCIDAWKLPAYRHLAGRFPHKTSSRVRAVQSLLEVAEGPLARFKTDALPLLAEMLAYEEDRHFMAHGLMIIEADQSVEIRLYRATAAGADIGFINWTIPYMRLKAEEAAGYCGRWLRLLYEIHDTLGWIERK